MQKASSSRPNKPSRSRRPSRPTRWEVRSRPDNRTCLAQSNRGSGRDAEGFSSAPKNHNRSGGALAPYAGGGELGPGKGDVFGKREGGRGAALALLPKTHRGGKRASLPAITADLTMLGGRVMFE